MFVPNEQTAYDQYAASRASLTIPREVLLTAIHWYRPIYLLTIINRSNGSKGLAARLPLSWVQAGVAEWQIFYSMQIPQLFYHLASHWQAATIGYPDKTFSPLDSIP